jgi:hypothetical protein
MNIALIVVYAALTAHSWVPKPRKAKQCILKVCGACATAGDDAAVAAVGEGGTARKGGHTVRPWVQITLGAPGAQSPAVQDGVQEGPLSLESALQQPVTSASEPRVMNSTRSSPSTRSTHSTPP